MGWLAGMLEGFQSRSGEIRAEKAAEAERASAREHSVLSALVNSPDPEIQSMAVAGLLHSAEPRKRAGGLKGWLGEMEQSPYLPHIQRLINTPVETQEPDASTAVHAPQALTGFIPQAPPQEGGAALPASSPTQIGEPPPTPIQPDVRSTGAASAAGPVIAQQTKTVSRPRQVFRSPEEQTRLTKRASAQGDVEGDVAGLVSSGVPEAEAREIVKQSMLRKAGGGGLGISHVMVEDAEGGQHAAIFDARRQAYIDPDTQEPIVGARPLTHTASTSMGIHREAAARELGYPSAAAAGVAGSAAMANVNRRAAELAAAQTTATTTARTNVTNAAVMDKPLDVSAAQQTGGVVGSTPSQYLGQRVGTAQERDRRIGVQNINVQLDHIKSLLGVLPKQGDLGNLAPGAALAIARRVPSTRTQVAQLEAALDNIVNSLARSVGEQRGTQTERDAERAYNTVVALKGSLFDPLKGDTQESAAARIDETLGYLQQVLKTLPGAPSPTGSVGQPPPTQAAPATAPAARPVATAAPAAAGPGSDWTMVNGVLHFKGKPY